MTHPAPFTSLRSLPVDLVMGLWFVIAALAGMAVDEVRRWRVVRLR